VLRGRAAGEPSALPGWPRSGCGAAELKPCAVPSVIFVFQLDY